MRVITKGEREDDCCIYRNKVVSVKFCLKKNRIPSSFSVFPGGPCCMCGIVSVMSVVLVSFQEAPTVSGRVHLLRPVEAPRFFVRGATVEEVVDILLACATGTIVSVRRPHF